MRSAALLALLALGCLSAVLVDACAPAPQAVGPRAKSSRDSLALPGPHTPPTPKRPVTDGGTQRSPTSTTRTQHELGESDLEDEFAALDDADPLTTFDGCFQLRGANACTGVGVVSLLCNGASNLLEPQAAQQLMACLHAMQDSPALCHATSFQDCVLAALSTAHAPLAYRTRCQQLLARCEIPPTLARYMTQTNCENALCVLRPGSRRELLDCYAESCDFAQCASGLL